jgi:RimJ/RimL family protein N-acetyltransferase
MSKNNLSVREIERKDIQSIIDYWLLSGDDFLLNLGVDINKMPAQKDWEEMLETQIQSPMEKKNSYCMIWLMDGKAVGHSNINKIKWGREAHMHLHLWQTEIRMMGLGTRFVKKTLPHFFQKFKLKTLYCEPYALNIAPHKTLARVGFKLVKEYTTQPGWINFEQPVKLWKLDSDDLF